MKPNLFFAFALTVSLFLNSGCSLQNNNSYKSEFILDNPTDMPISVTVNGKSYDLAAFQHEKITLNPGRHSMTTPYGETIDFIVTDENNGGVLNPTRSSYYRFNMVYVREGHNPTQRRIAPVLIDGIEYELPVTTVSGVILDEKTIGWQFPIHISFSETTYVEREAVAAAMRYKLFTKKELIEFVESETDNEGFHEANKVALPHTPHYEDREEIVYFVPDFKNAELKRLATEMVELDKAFGKAENAARQSELLKQYKALWSTYVKEGMKEEYDAEEYKKRAALVFHNFTKGVILL